MASHSFGSHFPHGRRQAITVTATLPVIVDRNSRLPRFAKLSARHAQPTWWFPARQSRASGLPYMTISLNLTNCG